MQLNNLQKNVYLGLLFAFWRQAPTYTRWPWTHYEAEIGLDLILQLPEGWDYRYAPPCLVLEHKDLGRPFQGLVLLLLDPLSRQRMLEAAAGRAEDNLRNSILSVHYVGPRIKLSLSGDFPVETSCWAMTLKLCPPCLHLLCWDCRYVPPVLIYIELGSRTKASFMPGKHSAPAPAGTPTRKAGASYVDALSLLQLPWNEAQPVEG